MSHSSVPGFRKHCLGFHQNSDVSRHVSFWLIRQRPWGRWFSLLGAVAELERNIIRERVAAGLQRAKKEGKTLGRPKVIVDREKVRDLHGKGNSVRTIATQLGL